MITGEQIRKAAKDELGVENIDWFYSVEKGHEIHMRRIEVQCKRCGTYRHKVFDLRENANVRKRLRDLKEQLIA